ncbi:preprotein translocase subunit TatA [Kitasatospora sp. MMS16-BH015]|uniref:Sec-independent protein translocase subunit TatA n=1 Tax=Kitasatospora sp. MMS16-BH015 TaxID=2018025 RepID=UPI000CA15687|nr:Sec-independent protein translocase subunit TatA [Kitasatospora sp. MMS16-BH015]AUG76206.1 preprotein translocase subunit TatA [Kitasatospora sp. MMS16-BH015]
MRVSPIAILVIVVLALLLFGAKKLPELARNLGKSARILKSEAKALREDGTEEEQPQAAPAPKAVKPAPGAPGADSRPVAQPEEAPRQD